MPENHLVELVELSDIHAIGGQILLDTSSLRRFTSLRVV
jgi:hypothetical protein